MRNKSIEYNTRQKTRQNQRRHGINTVSHMQHTFYKQKVVRLLSFVTKLSVREFKVILGAENLTTNN